MDWFFIGDLVVYWRWRCAVVVPVLGAFVHWVWGGCVV